MLRSKDYACKKLFNKVVVSMKTDSKMDTILTHIELSLLLQQQPRSSNMTRTVCVKHFNLFPIFTRVPHDECITADSVTVTALAMTIEIVEISESSSCKVNRLILKVILAERFHRFMAVFIYHTFRRTNIHMERECIGKRRIHKYKSR